MTGEERILEEVLTRCVRCGTCKAECPTYVEGRNEAQSARGRITILAAIIAGTMNPSVAAAEHVFSCLQCGACSRTCPSGLDVADAIRVGREQLRPYDTKGEMVRKAVAFGVRHRALAFTLAKVVPLGMTSGLRIKGVHPPVLVVPRSGPGGQMNAAAERRGRVGVFLGCSGKYLAPRLGKALAEVLERTGFEVVVTDEELCCGIPFLSLGMKREAEQLARKNLITFRSLEVDIVTSPCPTCIIALRDIYPKIAGEGIQEATDISSLILRGGKQLLKESISLEGFYHDPCHMRYGLQVTREPREILERCGVALRNDESPHCCGFGGVHSLRFAAESIRMGKRRVREIKKSRAEAVFTSCPGCLFQLVRAGSPVPVYHVVEAMAWALA